jgi:hypothetical protein
MTSYQTENPEWTTVFNVDAQAEKDGTLFPSPTTNESGGVEFYNYLTSSHSKA